MVGRKTCHHPKDRTSPEPPQTPQQPVSTKVTDSASQMWRLRAKQQHVVCRGFISLSRVQAKVRLSGHQDTFWSHRKSWLYSLSFQRPENKQVPRKQEVTTAQRKHTHTLSGDKQVSCTNKYQGVLCPQTKQRFHKAHLSACRIILAAIITHEKSNSYSWVIWYILRTLEAEAREFMASLSHSVSSKPAWSTQKDLASKN